MGLENEENSKIYKIIKEYVKILQELLERSEGHDRMLFESYVTQTNIIPYDFFDEEEDSCDKKGKILLKDFGKPYILFNDLKDSTNLLESFEKINFVCFYTAYIYYSSKMLAEILDIFGGKMIECTGDGNYSIFLEDKIRTYRLFEEGYQFFIEDSLKDDELERYLANFSEEENNYSYKNGYSKVARLLRYNHYDIEDCIKRQLPRSNKAEYIRYLFFLVFATFNTEVNKIIKKEKGIKKGFYTRVGCRKGACKITRIEAEGHISQDKLIGSIVHKAAHQASGK